MSTLIRLADQMRATRARVPEACELLERARPIEQALVEKQPATAEYRARLAMICCGLAGLLRDQGSVDRAEDLYREELGHWTRLANDGPEPIRCQLRHGEVLHNLADVLRGRGRVDEAIELERDAIERLSAVYRQNVLDQDSRTSLSAAFSTLCASSSIATIIARPRRRSPAIDSSSPTATRKPSSPRDF